MKAPSLAWRRDVHLGGMKGMARILIVEDEDKLRRALRRGLEEEGYEVVALENGIEGQVRVRTEPFDCLVLDLMLPGLDGIQLLRELRAAGCQTPALILTARGSVEDRVQGLDAGADDYLPKPFAWAEFLARVRACLRRRPSEAGPVLRAGDLELDLVRRRAIRGCREIELTPREFAVLEYLMRHKGELVDSRPACSRCLARSRGSPDQPHRGLRQLRSEENRTGGRTTIDPHHPWTGLQPPGVSD